MALTLFQEASKLNLSNTDLLFGVSSSDATKPQFQYITNIRDSASVLLTTIKQQPNPSYRGVFNLGTIMTQYVGYDTDPTLFNAGIDSLYYRMTNTGQYFKFGFTFQTGSSISSSIYVEPVQIPTTYDFIFLLNGTQDPNAGQYNWISQPYWRPEPIPSTATFNYNVALTTAPRTQTARNGDVMTIAVLNGKDVNNVDIQDIYYTEINVYNNSTLVHTEAQYNLSGSTAPNTGGPRTDSSQDTLPAWNSNVKTTLLSIGMGPQNITYVGNYDMNTQPWTHYTVTLYNQEAPDQPNFNGIYDQFTIYKDTQCTGFDPVRFIWSNEFGVWDYFNFTLATNKITKVERQNFQKTFVDYSTNQNSIPYNITNRGVTNFDTKIDEEFIVNSDWLTQEQAEWLETLMYSPSVYYQDGNNIIPIILTNTEFVNKTNPKSQKLYKLEVQYKLANPKRER
jgi:hypothetical protein